MATFRPKRKTKSAREIYGKFKPKPYVVVEIPESAYVSDDFDEPDIAGVHRTLARGWKGTKHGRRIETR